MFGGNSGATVGQKSSIIMKKIDPSEMFGQQRVNSGAGAIFTKTLTSANAPEDFALASGAKWTLAHPGVSVTTGKDLNNLNNGSVVVNHHSAEISGGSGLTV